MKEDIKKIVLELFGISIEPQTSVPEEKFGDLATNIAMQITKQLGLPPRDIANQIVERLQTAAGVEDVSVAGPGFINIRFTNDYIWGSHSINTILDEFLGRSYVVEYSCPNWFKELHTGHLYQTVFGDALARMIERSGAIVHRTTFGGDVGLHVAKALWSIVQDKESFEKCKQSDDPPMRATFITSHYVAGSAAYESDEHAKSEIVSLNKKIYELHNDKESHTDISEYYFVCRDWSTDYFHYFYKRIRVQDFEQYYPESSTQSAGIALVKEGLDQGIFELSDGAVVYKGEKDGLHTRVFLTKEGLPTYEAKDLGLISIEKKQFEFEHRILITGSDQVAYMQVVWAAMNRLEPSFANTMTHLANGIVKFADGSKMSSRLGNVTRAVDVLDAVAEKIESTSDSPEKNKIVLGAIKYEFLKYHIGSNIAFDIDESVSTKGNSGPYLQYALVRAKKILLSKPLDHAGVSGDIQLDEFERRLARKLALYTTIFADATRNMSPNTLCLYLYELAQIFNQFYENDRVIDSGSVLRWELVMRYAVVLGDGLSILGIDAPEQM